MYLTGTNNMIDRILKVTLPMLLVMTVVSTALAADFNSDGKADFAVFRADSSTWLSESNGKADPTSARWGNSTDVLVPADYDGDGQTDLATWRPSNGVWYIQQSGDGGALLVKWGMTTMHPTGGLADVPVPADYDADGRADIAIWRPDTGEWWVLKSSTDYDDKRASVFRWGKLGDVPVEADYDGDRRADFAVFRPMENRWFVYESSTGKIRYHAFGLAGLDTLVPADYTGDGKADVAVYRSGVWWMLDSKTGETEAFHFGFNDDMPVPADFDGDGTTDFATYRSGTWYVNDSAQPRLRSFNFGQAGDVPVSSNVVRQSIVAIP